MRNFEFRLERVLEYRRLQEGWAKDALREAQAALAESERALERILDERESALTQDPKSVEGLIDLESYVTRLEDDAEAQRNVIAILAEEVEKARQEWIEARRALQTMERLREREYQQWEAELAREEQKALDEWTHSRRPA